jgi:chromosome segregation ATPase
MNTPTLTGTYTCTHHNDAERTACPVCLVTALTAERDELRAALALGQLNCDAAYDELRGDCDELRGDVVRLSTERDQLRAENIALRAAQKACEACDEPTAFEVRQFRAEMERLRSDRDCEKRLRKDADELRENAIARAERYRLASLKLDAELATERERVRVLREALENLCDEQNGAPLETRRDEWQLAMEDAREAIVAAEGAK